MCAGCQQGDFACPRLCVPRSATTRAVAVLRVCGARRGSCMALCALQSAPQPCIPVLSGSALAKRINLKWSSPRCIQTRTVNPVVDARQSSLAAAATLRSADGAPFDFLNLGSGDTSRILTGRLSRPSSWRRAGSGGFAASWLFHSRRQALTLLRRRIRLFALPNVRAKRATTAGRQARAGENVPRTTGPGLVACRWRSA